MKSEARFFIIKLNYKNKLLDGYTLSSSNVTDTLCFKLLVPQTKGNALVCSQIYLA